MQEKKIELSFILAHLSELSAQEQQLVANAKAAFKTAYAPYSGFLVGASVLLENGEVINGSNQENVAYPSGLCAERVALFYAGAKFPDVKINTVAISVLSKNFEVKDVISPCGACRQVMAEYEDKQHRPIKVILHSPTDEVLITNRVEDLLPFMFKSPLLKQH
ncbi:MAG: cytidine deaminase [Cryomorphaceae bacterium]|jgi:cytidine deaminase|nr:cytidine deaminase [Cryomorphaceae bacterium]